MVCPFCLLMIGYLTWFWPMRQKDGQKGGRKENLQGFPFGEKKVTTPPCSFQLGAPAASQDQKTLLRMKSQQLRTTVGSQRVLVTEQQQQGSKAKNREEVLLRGIPWFQTPVSMPLERG